MTQKHQISPKLLEKLGIAHKPEQTLPMVVDVDTIRELRLSGRSWEASQLLKAHQASIDAQRKQVRKELKRNSQKIERRLRVHKLKSLGLCLSCGKVPPKQGCVRCVVCLSKHRTACKKCR